MPQDLDFTLTRSGYLIFLFNRVLSLKLTWLLRFSHLIWLLSNHGKWGSFKGGGQGKFCVKVVPELGRGELTCARSVLPLQRPNFQTTLQRLSNIFCYFQSDFCTSVVSTCLIIRYLYSGLFSWVRIFPYKLDFLKLIFSSVFSFNLISIYGIFIAYRPYYKRLSPDFYDIYSFFTVFQ